MKSKNTDCYIDVWKEANFGGKHLRLHGPAEFPLLQFDDAEWGNQIGSLRVGPHAFVLAYHDRDFQSQLMTFGPNDQVADLSELKFDDEMESVKVIDSMKIFDDLMDRSALPTDGDAAGARPEGTQAEHDKSHTPKKNPHKGRRR